MNDLVLKTKKTNVSEKSVCSSELMHGNQKVFTYVALTLIALLLFSPISSAYASEENGAPENEEETELAEEVSAPLPEDDEVITEEFETEKVTELADIGEEVLSEETSENETESVEDTDAEPVVNDESGDSNEVEPPHNESEEVIDNDQENIPTHEDTQTATSTNESEVDDGASRDEANTATTTDEGVDVPPDVLGTSTATSTDTGEGNGGNGSGGSDDAQGENNEQTEDGNEATSTPDINEEDETEAEEVHEASAAEEGEVNASTTEEIASSTEEVIEEEDDNTNEIVVANLINNQNRHQFADSECVLVGEDSFYCSKNKVETQFDEDGVHVEIDAEGDKEIFLQVDGKVSKITDNRVDDDAPMYDQVSNSIVWHSLINDRYQIMQYDLKKRETTQITDTTYNNMEPIVYGNAVVWQAWIGNGWEIMHLENDTLTQLTDNEVHDVSPSMRGRYIMWQSQTVDGWKVKVYDRETGAVETIDGGGGTSLENPRFVLVYESTKENGDIETLGYDFESKEVVPLSSEPTPVPKELPEPEHTGEERALVGVQNTPKVETKDDENDKGDDGENDDTDIVLESSSSTLTAENDLIVATTTPSSAEIATSSVALVIDPVATEEVAETTNDIQFELVIPKQEEKVVVQESTSTKSQLRVASTTFLGDNSE